MSVLSSTSRPPGTGCASRSTVFNGWSFTSLSSLGWHTETLFNSCWRFFGDQEPVADPVDEVREAGSARVFMAKGIHPISHTGKADNSHFRRFDICGIATRIGYLRSVYRDLFGMSSQARKKNHPYCLSPEKIIANLKTIWWLFVLTDYARYVYVDLGSGGDLMRSVVVVFYEELSANGWFIARAGADSSYVLRSI